MRCPMCGKEFDVREAVMSEAEVEWNMEVVPAFSNAHYSLVYEYVMLFDVYPFRKRFLTVLRLLKDLLKLYLKGKFEWKKRIYSISRDGVVEALKITCSRTFEPPLKNHNWLKTVMIGISEKELKNVRDQQDRALRKREAGIRRPTTEPPPDDDDCISIGEFARQENLDVAGLANMIGKKML